MFYEPNRHRDESQYEYKEGNERYYGPTGPSHREINERSWMTKSHKKKDQGKKGVSRQRERIEPQTDQPGKGYIGHDQMGSSSKQSVHHMPPVELSYRQKVETRGQHSEPGSPADRVEVDSHPVTTSIEDLCSPLKEERFSKLESHLQIFRYNEFTRAKKTYDQRGDNEEETCQRTCNSYIKQLAPIFEGGLDLDYGPESPKGYQRWWSRDDIRQSRIDPVISADQVVSHFMGQQNDQDRNCKRHTIEQVTRMVPNAQQPAH